MKKITLFAAVAALAAGSAMAAVPHPTIAAKPQRIARHIMTPGQLPMNAQHAMTKSAAIKSLRVKAAPEVAADGDDDVVVITNTARYAPSEQAFYMGLSPQFYAYNITVGLTGIRNQAGFYNLTEGADSQSWLWREPVGVNDEGTENIYEDHVSTDRNLLVGLKPDMFFASPDLTAKFGNEEVTYSPEDVLAYYCGGSFYDWGWAVNDDVAYEDLTVYDVFGASMAGMPYEQTWFPYAAWMQPSTNIEGISELFGANATYTGWDQLFAQFTDAKYENPAVTGYTTLIPIMPSPYQMGHMWLDLIADIKSEMELTAVICPITEDGIDYEHPLGKGSVILPAGQYPKQVTNTDGTRGMEMPIIEFYALDSEGYETDLFPCIYNTPVAVTISGFNKDNTNYFIPMLYDTSRCALDEEPLADYMFPGHAYVNLDVECTPKTEGATKETIKAEMPASYFAMYANEAKDSLWIPSDYGMFFNVEFPMLVNVTEGAEDAGTARFSVKLPAEGGSASVDLFSYYNIVGNLEEGLMTATIPEDAKEWLSYTAKVEQASANEAPIQVFEVTAKPLPEGGAVKGRQSYVLFSGLACDFAITVAQGEVAGINDIKVVPVAKGTQYFDLQGRRLSGAPASGLYIERNGDKAVKRIAR